VRDEDDRAGEILKRSLELLDCLQVEVVRGFAEHERVDPLGGQESERRAAAFTRRG
jgi:hypothetical protein